MRRLLGGIAALACATVPFTAAIDHAAATTAQCANQTGVKVSASDSPATVNVTDTTTNAPVSVVVTITGTTFTVATADPTHPLTNASWCVKSATNTNNGTGTAGASTSTNKQGVVQGIGYVVLANVTTRLGACYAVPGFLDFWVFGPINTYTSAAFVDSVDGTCSGDFDTTTTYPIVAAADFDAAIAECQVVAPELPVLANQLVLEAPTAPNDYWVCGLF